jgi:hypothetical protein
MSGSECSVASCRRQERAARRSTSGRVPLFEKRTSHLAGLALAPQANTLKVFISSRCVGPQMLSAAGCIDSQLASYFLWNDFSSLANWICFLVWAEMFFGG